MLGFDFLLHGGVLAYLYTRPSPFLLPPLSAFQLIPVGYASFLLLAILHIWLMHRLNLNGWRKGLVFGLEIDFLDLAVFPPCINIIRRVAGCFEVLKL